MADKEAIKQRVKDALAAYADSYRLMSGIGDGKIQARSVEEDLRSTITKTVLRAIDDPAA